jgi:hypothetical protein
MKIIKCIWTVKNVSDGNKTHISLNEGTLIIEDVEISPFSIDQIKFINIIFSNSIGEPLNCKYLKYSDAENGNPGNSHIHIGRGKSTFNDSVYLFYFYF